LCVLGVNEHLVMPKSMPWCAYLLESIFFRLCGPHLTRTK
jgi:hypothetical protein